ncbi:hypothetical protein, partial [Klebsiella pneumoniae]
CRRTRRRADGSRFDEATRSSAYSEYLDSNAPFREGARYRVPGEFVVVTGRVPSSDRAPHVPGGLITTHQPTTTNKEQLT